MPSPEHHTWRRIQPLAARLRQKSIRPCLALLLAAIALSAGCQPGGGPATSIATLPEPPTQAPSPATPAQPTPEATAPEATAAALATPPESATEIGVPLPDPGVQLAAQPAEVGYAIPLTTRHLTPTTASFSFELERPQPGFLLYRPDLPGLESWFRLALDPTAVRHQLTLQDLAPGHRYRVQVGLGEHPGELRPVGLGGAEWGPLEFRTPNQAELGLRIGVIGDTGFGDSTTAELVSLMDRQSLDFVLHTGDVVYNAHEQEHPLQAWAVKFFRPFAPLLASGPVYLAPGNHEYDRVARWQGSPAYYYAFPPLRAPSLEASAQGNWYAFSYADLQFLMLDSQLFHGVAGRSEQTDWLRERLQDPAFRFSIPVFHTPPFTSGRHRTDGVALRAEWIPLFESAGVPLVFSGHDHNYQRILVNGITYVVSGGGSAVLYPLSVQAEGSQAFARRSHFVLLEINADAIALTSVEMDGEILDQVVLSPPE